MSPDQTPTPDTWRIDLDLQRRIEAYARAVGIAPADVVRQAFEEYEATHNGARPEGEATAFEILSRAGLIGCLKGAPDIPTDLATNPEHMEGFGRE